MEDKLNNIHKALCVSAGGISLMILRRTLYPKKLRVIIGYVERSLELLKDIERDSCND